MAGFNHARTITKASAPGLDTGQDVSLDASFPLKGHVVFDFSNVTKWPILFDILQSA